MAKQYPNDANIPAVSMTAIEVGAFLDHIPSCDICEEQEMDFIIFPGLGCIVGGKHAVYCHRCATAYLSTARLTKIERRQRNTDYWDFVTMLADNGVWEE